MRSGLLDLNAYGVIDPKVPDRAIRPEEASLYPPAHAATLAGPERFAQTTRMMASTGQMTSI